MRKAVSIIGCIGVIALALWGKYVVDRKNLAGLRIVPPVTEASAQYESHSLQRFSLGFDNAIADLLWVRLLQNATYKQHLKPGVSWEFAQVNAITDLDRNYSNAYQFGSAFLSVFRRDKIGARHILEKWAQNYPMLWKAHFHLGFHLYYEMGEYQAAGREVLKAAALPRSPTWLDSLAIRLMSNGEAYLPALQIALSLYPTLLNDESKFRLRARIRSLRYHLQKEEWETALAEFQKSKHAKPRSLADLRPFLHAERGVAEVEEEWQNNEDLREIVAERFRFDYLPNGKGIVGLLSKEDQVLEVSGAYKNPNESDSK